jgi:hypothetical protein
LKEAAEYLVLKSLFMIKNLPNVTGFQKLALSEENVNPPTYPQVFGMMFG